MAGPDVNIGNAYRELGRAWVEARGLEGVERWKAQGIVAAAMLIVPIVAFVMLIRGDR